MFELGKVSPKIGTYSTVFLLIVILFLCFVSVGLLFGNYSDSVIVKGEIIKDEYINIVSTDDGYIYKTYVNSGDGINRGSHLVDISVNTANISVGNNSLSNELINKQEELHEKFLNSKKNELIKLNERALSLKNTSAIQEREIKNLKMLKTQVENNISLSKEKMDSFSYAYKQKAISKMDYISMKEEYGNILYKLNEVNSRIFMLEKEKNEVFEKIRENEEKITKLEYLYKEQENNIIEKQYSLKASDKITISSPVKGVIDSVVIRNGERVKKGDVLFILKKCNSKSPVIKFKIPDNLAGSIEVGQKISASVTAFPYDRYGMVHAEIISTSQSAVLDEGVKYFMTYASVLSLPEGKITEHDIRNGMEVTAYIKIKKQSLLEWIFLPFKKSIGRGGMS